MLSYQPKKKKKKRFLKCKHVSPLRAGSLSVHFEFPASSALGEGGSQGNMCGGEDSTLTSSIFKQMHKHAGF